VHSLNLLVLRSRDIEATRAFYECLGFAFTKHKHGSGPEHFAHEDEAGVLELYPAGEHQRPDTAGLGFRANDLEHVASSLGALGFEQRPMAPQPWGTSFMVRDPDARRVEITAA
jgi:hypothetical protein